MTEKDKIACGCKGTRHVWIIKLLRSPDLSCCGINSLEAAVNALLGFLLATSEPLARFTGPPHTSCIATMPAVIDLVSFVSWKIAG